MELLIKIYDIMDKRMETPEPYGTYHLCCVAVVLLLSLFACVCARRMGDKTERVIVGFVWVILVILEVYKQLVYGFSVEDGTLVWDYQWYAFPYQFCSSPYFVLPFIAFSKNEKIRSACIAYMISFSFFAGVAVMCLPTDVFISVIGINVQTMVVHGSQVILGVLFAAKHRKRMNVRFFLGGVLVFAIMSIIAMILNVAVYHAFMNFGIDETFNMFFISPYFECTLPIIGPFWHSLPYPGFLLLYFGGFVICAVLMFVILKLVTRPLSFVEKIKE